MLKTRKKTSMTKIIATLVMCATVLSSVRTASATNVKSEDREVQHAVVVEREDVSITEAMNDTTFSLPQNSANSCMPMALGTVYWKVWGDSEYHRGGEGSYTPIGYSEQRTKSQVLSTYHYTRTYVTYMLSTYGDSGRKWGSGTVKATGSQVHSDIFEFGVHKVKYGTTA